MKPLSLRLLSGPLINYAKFSGRATRTEYFSFLVFCLVLYALPAIQFIWLPPYDDAAAVNRVVEPHQILKVATFIPLLAIGARRLHDMDWDTLAIILPAAVMTVSLFMAGSSIPLLAVLGLVLFSWKGTSGPNRFGPDPRDSEAANAKESFGDDLSGTLK